MVKTRYLVEHRPNDSEPIYCQSADEAVAVAKDISGVAWRHDVRYDTSGCPINSWRRFSAESNTWDFQ